ncbi:MULTISPECIES: type IV toxin-antitoxin system AbiEi family antitoxin domain-containing protein [Halomonadaceae]|uniref:type IV toxin-antitoxin system AbiEi family antitoxin domain-containing protein n=1 Tax=Halomonadaceae TaxID=28256 RepID=UPI001582A51D|nr:MULTISPECIES: type IV toxin-antitoxin system AbiEi family antitoxin domain-containing protein [Halomonas]MDI4637156.1 type IV toxin-antitoxin system AbiEi family antitoxin [Halomonas sp. BMC7]NUJ58324.1 type IV toxin-antitoxin system AbiEi family antitoxin [Halomonas taeanensis]
MKAEKSQKLKRVLEAVPAGFLVDARWLTAQGLAYETFRDYVKRGWLERVSRGVFRRPAPQGPLSEPINWKTCLLSMQQIMGYGVHVGGTTALDQQGYAHYLRLGHHATVWVYGDVIPNWLVKLPLNAPVVTRRRSLFDDPTLGVVSDSAAGESHLPWDWAMTISAPERAILEAMDELPDQESFHNLDMVFQSLTTLRPKLLTALLHSCNKVKVRRLFFVFADHHDHPWRKRLNPADFNLGSGDRALVSGGRIHPRYRIMVPDEFISGEISDGG